MVIQKIKECSSTMFKWLKEHIFIEPDFLANNKQLHENIHDRRYLDSFHCIIDNLNPAFFFGMLLTIIVLTGVYISINDYVHKNDLGDVGIMHKYMHGYKTTHLKYVVDNKDYTLDFPVFTYAHYHFLIMPYVDYYDQVYNPEQYELMHSLTEKIKNITTDEKKQVEIAVSLVQNIPYDFIHRSWYQPSRRPYNVLYDNGGVCGEKSQLMTFILKDLGYDTVLFTFDQANHEVAGIKCSVGDFRGTGYCYLETTVPVGLQNKYDIQAEITDMYHVSPGKSYN